MHIKKGRLRKSYGEPKAEGTGLEPVRGFLPLVFETSALPLD